MKMRGKGKGKRIRKRKRNGKRNGNALMWRFLAHCSVNLVHHLNAILSSNAIPEL